MKYFVCVVEWVLCRSVSIFRIVEILCLCGIENIRKVCRSDFVPGVWSSLSQADVSGWEA